MEGTGMTLQIDFVWFVGMLIAFFGACAGAGKMLLSQTTTHLDDKFRAQELARTENHTAMGKRLDSIEVASRADANEWQRIERELLLFRAELPRDYIRRDDFVQAIGGINTRIDNFALRMERALDNNRKGAGSL